MREDDVTQIGHGVAAALLENVGPQVRLGALDQVQPQEAL